MAGFAIILSVLKKTGLTIVDGVTINEITTSAERINFYKEQLKANVETMEGAALHYVCLCEKIPFLQIRGVSNYVGERNKNKWTLREAIANLNIELQTILIKLFSMKLTLGFSPCPNDTFIFDALVNKKIDTGDLDFEPVLEDIETLNKWSSTGKLDITKLSFPAFFQNLKNMLHCLQAGALGNGVGPLLVAKNTQSVTEISKCKNCDSWRKHNC